MAEQNSIIEIKNLSKAYKQKHKVVNALNDISLDIKEGEIFGIIGLSGAGKSTLVRCMNFLEKPTGGSVIFNGKDLGSLSKKDLNMVRRDITMIFQQFNLLMQRTALENVCFPMELAKVKKEDARKRAKELLEMVGLGDRLDSYPSQLSGGQKQRVAIARALATNPKVLLCDEATSALDPNTTNSVLSLLKEINKQLGVTIIIITHEMSVIERICNRVAIIDKSQIAEVAPVEELFSNPKTEIGKHLVYPDEIRDNKDFSNLALRVVFNGISSYEPVIANMILECKTPVNILFADTRNVDGKAMGQMIIQLPDDAVIASKMRHYLSKQEVIVEEVDLNV
ncbi:methionine ABC transporter ATP-binding protein [Lachnospiraceae bacterium KM106-2]|nr:methionine ABC transporter ATP-binding protein [Lachnospiraceae bacterium KM106-2]